MKHFFVLIIGASIALAMAGCGGDDGGGTDVNAVIVGDTGGRGDLPSTVDAASDSGSTARDTRDSSGSDGPPIYVRFFFHFENITDLTAGEAAIKKQLGALVDLGIPAEANMQRGEQQLAKYDDDEVLDLLKASEVALGYHPHPAPPFNFYVHGEGAGEDCADAWASLTPKPAGFRDLAWNAMVDALRDYESRPFEFKAATLSADASKTGGAKRLNEIVGKSIASMMYGYEGLAAAPTYVMKTTFGLPTQLDSGGSGDSLFDVDVDLYWYMGTLVFSHPNARRANLWVESEVKGAASALATARTATEPVLFIVGGTDKVAAINMQKYVCAFYRQGETEAGDLFPPEKGTAECTCGSACEAPLVTEHGTTEPIDQCWPRDDSPWKDNHLANDGAREGYYDGFDEVLAMLRAEPRVRFVSTNDIVDLVAAPRLTLTAAELDGFACRLIGALQGDGIACAASGFTKLVAPPLEIGVSGKYASLTDLYEGFFAALATLRRDGALPAEVSIESKVLGPRADPPSGSCGGAHIEAPAGGFTGQTLLQALGAGLPEFVPDATRLSANAEPIGPTELLWHLAQLYRAAFDSDGPGPDAARQPRDVTLKRLGEHPCDAPDGAPGAQATDADRWSWYSVLQYWTTKRAAWK